MEEMEVPLYICRDWAEALSGFLKQIRNREFLQSFVQDEKERIHLMGALTDIQEALQEVGIG